MESRQHTVKFTAGIMKKTCISFLKMRREAMKVIHKYLALAVGLMMMPQVYGATLQGISENSTTLVPLRTISEELNAKVDYVAETKNITMSYKNNVVKLTIGSKETSVNGNTGTLAVLPKVVSGTTYVPLRFVGEALGAQVDYKAGVVSITLEGDTKTWDLQVTSADTPTSSKTVASKTSTVKGKAVKYLTVDLNNPKIKLSIATANGKMNQATTLKSMVQAAGAKASINGTYFAAYNGDMPMPDGTLVKNGKPLHITDIGVTLGITPDNKVLIDFVTTRVQGYRNGSEAWTSYRVNRSTPDSSATVIFTPEYSGNIPLLSGQVAVVCKAGEVIKKVTETRTVPEDGFILVMNSSRSGNFNIGDQVSYKVTYSPKNTSAADWEAVTYALSAGPSLLINGNKTGNPADEKFTEEKILTQVAQRSFIGVNAKNELIMGTVVASVSELKDIVKEMGLTSAMCLDGGASSGLYYNNSYVTTPGREINNCITVSY